MQIFKCSDLTVKKVETVVVSIALIVILFWMIGGAFVDEKVAIAALENAGYSEIKITDKAIFFISLRGGSSSDDARFTAITKNPAGKTVTCHVFASWLFKGATIRYME